jgi:hypothetical protein
MSDRSMIQARTQPQIRTELGYEIFVLVLSRPAARGLAPARCLRMRDSISCMAGMSIPNICEPPTRQSAVGPRIFIFGCARSGTTLVLNLFRAFNHVTVRNMEQCSTHVMNDAKDGWVIAKRTPHCATHLLADLPLLRDLWIIDVLRDPRDVVTSVLPSFPGFYCDFGRWERDVRVAQAVADRHIRFLRIRYEELLLHPDQIQCDIAGVLNLNVRVQFGSFVSVVPKDLPQNAVQALGGVRPLDSSRAGRWRRSSHYLDRVTEQLRAYPEMESTLQYMGYAPTVQCD